MDIQIINKEYPNIIEIFRNVSSKQVSEWLHSKKCINHTIKIIGVENE